MYNLKIVTGFAAAHNLRNYKGKCENLHGHNWKVEVEMSSQKLNNIGLSMDFKELKSGTEFVIDELDHHYLNELPPFNEINPSSENIAQYIYGRLKKKFEKYEDIQIYKVTIWESDSACASYYE
ncbi:6-carboxytetrahydropterin synthase QueD [Candidatus Desantisbacteria bacterium]|nr:6-carboxytetrahydropterin synthase QueD [Candidatus Desantisbacteria bacterium]